MAKIGTFGGKILARAGKLLMGCGCCCLDPEYRNLAPPDNASRIQPPGAGAFVCDVEVRYCDSIKLYISVGGTANFVLKGTSGVGKNANNYFFPTVGDSPSYSPAWSGNMRMTAVQGAVGISAWVFEGYEAPLTIWWKLLLENDCGSAQVWTPARLFILYLDSQPPPWITCNGCGRNQLKSQYTVNVTGAEGAFLLFENNSPFTVPHVDPLSSCLWKNDTDFGQDPFGRDRSCSVIWNGGTNRWEMTLFYSASALGTNNCRVFLRGSTNPCQPTGTYTKFSCDNSDCLATNCGQAIVAVVA